MKSLFVVGLLMLLSGMAVSVVKEYIYVSQTMKWTAAQDYCRQHYGDLASITTVEENKKAVMVLGKNSNFAWIGLNRAVPHLNSWMWSGGEGVSFTKWSFGEPNDVDPGESCVVMDQNGWNDISCDRKVPLICSQILTVVNERNTWDEALKHCRKYYTDLTFVDSGSLLDLLKTETVQAQTASVWTGLRFLDGQWFWLNGMPLGSLVSLPSCPAWPYRCAAYNFNTNTWENRDCNEEFNFLCYS